MAVSFAILARLITPSQMGVFAILALFAAIIQVIPFPPFVNQAITKYVAESIEQGDLETAASVFYQSIRASFLGTAAMSVILILGASELSTWLLGNSNQYILFQVVAVDAVLGGCTSPVTSSLLALQKFKEQAWVGTVTTLVRQAFIIILVILMRGLVGLVLGWVIGDSLALTLYSFYVVKALGPPRFAFPLGKLFTYSWPLCVNSLVSFISSWFDRALLLLFVPLATLGIYNAMITAFTALTSISGAFSNIVFSAYSSMQSTRHKEMLGRAIHLASRYLTLAMAPLALGLLATAKPALTLFVGQAYATGTVPLMILTGVYAVTLIGAALSPLFLARGETLIASGISIITVAINLSTGYVLIPTNGIVGASIARGLGMVSSTVLILAFLKRRIDLRIDVQAIVKSLIAGGVMALFVFLIQIPLYNQLLMPVYVSAGAVVYLIMLRLLRAIRSEDTDLIWRYFGSKLSFIGRILTKVLVPRGSTRDTP
jgi:O-antigen/teichoic acid export membrane protein